MTSATPTAPVASGRDELTARLEQFADRIRPPDVVMRPERFGVARLTKFSFARSLVRRAARWRIDTVACDLDAQGRGRVVYRIVADGHELHFVAFTTTIDESLHTDRVVAPGWEVTAALVDGPLPGGLLRELEREVPLQERGRLPASVLVLTRGNRSVRFFEYLVDELAAGRQPDAARVGDAGYIMRSTAFYGNGKFGTRSYDGIAADHPLTAPYRAQMLAAWLFRELSYDSVEACARARVPDTATVFDPQWRRFFGLGNATGLGLVPYFVRHPQVINAWFAVRELALAHVRTLPGDDERLATLRWWVDRAATHFAHAGSTPRAPWMDPPQLVAACDRVRAAVAALTTAADDGAPFDDLYRWAEAQDVETCELVVSLLVELDDSIDDDTLDRLLRIEDDDPVDPLAPIGTVQHALAARYRWLDEPHLGGDIANGCWWAISDDTDEPRRVARAALDPVADGVGRDVAIDVARQLRDLRADVADRPADESIGAFLAAHPQHTPALARTLLAAPYGEAYDDVCAAGFLPLRMQRFQLAMYGMDNFSPKSTDWLRVTLFQGAPRAGDDAADFDDCWVWPTAPGAPGARA